MKFDYDFNIETQNWECTLTVGERTECCIIQHNPIMTPERTVLHQIKNLCDIFSV